MTIHERTPEAINFTGVIPYLGLSDAGAASAFYKRAFGAVEIDRRLGQDGKRLIHCAVSINGGYVFFCDFFPEYGHVQKEPQAYVLHLQVSDADAWWKRAIDTGCQEVMPLELQFWGDRYGQLKDPFGVTWSIGEGQGGQP